jgi:predicted flap endonuclease-1-like 5' DNA nuclease
VGERNESVRVVREHETGEEDVTVTELTDVKYVGPATAAVLEDASFGVEDIQNRTVTYEMLREAGVNPGVAGRLRREHSLSWSFEYGNDLRDRSTQVRGLRDEERAWIAASSGDWERDAPEPATTDGSGDVQAEEAAWRDRSSPDPVTDVPEIDERLAEELAEAGITSVRSLAIANPERVADSLAFDRNRVIKWHDSAHELL